MPELTPLAVVQTYEELHQALRARSDELGFTRLDLDHVAGWADGLAGKILAPEAGRTRRTRRVGMKGLELLLGALGCRLIVASDPEATEQVKRLAFGREGRPPLQVTQHWRNRRRAGQAAI